jgi:hypothetical protein
MPDKPLDIPVTAPFMAATMQHTHVRMEMVPNDDPSLSYDLALPKHWAYSEQFGPVTDGLLQPRGLGFFTQSIEPGAPVIAVTVTTIPFEVPVDTWMRLAFEREGWQVVAGQWFPGPNGLFFDISGVRVADDLPLVRRTSARAGGCNIFCVNTLCARTHWDVVKETFWTAHVTFALLGGAGSSQMEGWLEAATVNPSFETVFPMSWFAEPAESTDSEVSGLHIRLADVERETLLAYLLVRAARKPNAEPTALLGLVADAMRMLEKSGLALKGDLRRQWEDDDPRSLGIKGWLGGFVGDGTIADGPILMRLGFIERDDVVFTMALYSPRIEDDLLIALRAQRAFEIVRGGLQLKP